MLKVRHVVLDLLVLDHSWIYTKVIYTKVISFKDIYQSDIYWTWFNGLSCASIGDSNIGPRTSLKFVVDLSLSIIYRKIFKNSLTSSSTIYTSRIMHYLSGQIMESFIFLAFIVTMFLAFIVTMFLQSCVLCIVFWQYPHQGW
jgi:hypothetical protein